MRLKKAIRLLASALGAYLLAFLMVFEPLGPPCRTREAWLGPKLRFDEGYADIGKVLEYQQGGHLGYTLFAPLCRAWLQVQPWLKPKPQAASQNSTPTSQPPAIAASSSTATHQYTRLIFPEPMRRCSSPPPNSRSMNAS